MSNNAAQLLEGPASSMPSHLAVIGTDRTWTYAELDEYAQQVAQGLRLADLSPRAHVGLLAPSGGHFVAAYFGILKAGMVAVPLNTRLRPGQISRLLDFADVEACLIADPSPTPALAETAIAGALNARECRRVWALAPAMDLPADGRVRLWEDLAQPLAGPFDTAAVEPGDIAVLSYTSGTTLEPRAAMVSHQSELLGASVLLPGWGLGAHDVLLASIGLFTGYGRVGLLNPGLAGSVTFVFLAAFDPVQVVEAMKRHKATGFFGVPAMFFELRRAHFEGRIDLRTLLPAWRYVMYGGAPMPRDLREFFAHEIGLTTVQGYGLTECNGIALSPPDARPSLQINDPLQPLWPDDLWIVDEYGHKVAPGEIGEVTMRGPIVMDGYYKNPELSAACLRGGCFHTDDYARQLDDGTFELLGRKCDTINRGGYMVYPAEVESVILDHPDVEHAAVKAIPDERMGSEVAAYVVLKKDSMTDRDALYQWIKEQLASFQYPRHLMVMAAFPLGPTGKVEKHALPDPRAQG
jgi:long-chain acyl-CoA synthetase